MKSSIGILLLVFVSVFGVVADTGIEGRTYTNEQYFFEISLPKHGYDGWIITDDAFGISLVIISDQLGLRSLNVGVVVFPEPLSLDDYLSMSVETLKDIMPDWKEISRAEIEIDGIPASELIYSGSSFASPLSTWIHRFAVRRKFAFIITGVSTPDIFKKEVFQEIMETFEFLPMPRKRMKKLATTWAKVKAE